MIPLGGMLKAELRRVVVVVGRRANRPEYRVGANGRLRMVESREPLTLAVRVQYKKGLIVVFTSCPCLSFLLCNSGVNVGSRVW